MKPRLEVNVHRRRFARAAAWILAFGLSPLLPGCAAAGFVAHLFGGGSQVQAVYELEDRATAVLVDDPTRALGAAALPGVVANNVTHHLEEQEVLKTARIVPQGEVHRLAKQLGEDFAITPIDQIGRSLGAAQVIHVEIESATLYEHSRQVTHPRSAVSVKVIDVEHRKRLFPVGGTAVDPSYTPPGHFLQIAMEVQGVDESSRGMETLMLQQLAEETGRRVAELFFDHSKSEPGSMIK